MRIKYLNLYGYNEKTGEWIFFNAYEANERGLKLLNEDRAALITLGINTRVE